MSKEPLNFLKHIRDECIFLLSIKESHTVLEHFMADETAKRAVARSLEIIGEATKNIPIDVKLKWNRIQWREMAGMRDRLIHDYMGVNYTIVWDVLMNKITDLHLQVMEVIQNENDVD